MSQIITKIALVVKDPNDNILVLKKKDLDVWILPGGKPISQFETHSQTLSRECWEELKVRPTCASFLMECQDTVAGTISDILKMHVYYGDLPQGERLWPSEEIEYCVWAPLRDYRKLPLAPSLKNTVAPFLCQLLAYRDFLNFDGVLPESARPPMQRVISEHKPPPPAHDA